MRAFMLQNDSKVKTVYKEWEKLGYLSVENKIWTAFLTVGKDRIFG